MDGIPRQPGDSQPAEGVDAGAAAPVVLRAPPQQAARFWGLGEVLRLSIPTSLTMINTTIMQFVDGLMVARIAPGGAEALSAQGTAGITHFTAMSLMVGVLSVVNTFVAQNLGAGRLDKCSQYTWCGLYLALLSAGLLLPLALLAGPLFAFFDHAGPVQAMEVTYFRYLVAGSGLFLTGHVLQQFFFGTHRPMIVFAVSAAANLVNIVGDYALIFGRWGLPALGLEGAAIATLIGSGVGLALLAGKFLLGRDRRRYDTRGQWRLHWRQAWQILRVGVPAGGQMFMDVLGWTFFIALLIGGLRTVEGVALPEAGTIHLAATMVATRYMHVSFMPAVGISIATTALVGRHIGARQEACVWRRTYAAVALAMLYMGGCGLLFFLGRHALVSLYLGSPQAPTPEDAARRAMIVLIGGRVMMLSAVFQVFDAVGIVFSGALRGAGDTLWPALAMAGLNLTLLIGGGLFMLHVLPQFESIGIWAVASLYVIVLGVVMFARFQAGKWRRINLLNDGSG